VSRSPRGIAGGQAQVEAARRPQTAAPPEVFGARRQTPRGARTGPARSLPLNAHTTPAAPQTPEL